MKKWREWIILKEVSRKEFLITFEIPVVLSSFFLFSLFLFQVLVHYRDVNLKSFQRKEFHTLWSSNFWILRPLLLTRQFAILWNRLANRNKQKKKKKKKRKRKRRPGTFVRKLAYLPTNSALKKKERIVEFLIDLYPVLALRFSVISMAIISFIILLALPLTLEGRLI